MILCLSLSLVFPDLEFVKTFLYTYQSFATPERLLRKLIERYNVVRPGGMSLKGFGVMKQTIQVRVINALKLWVDLSVDYKGEREIKASASPFLGHRDRKMLGRFTC